MRSNKLLPAVWCHFLWKHYHKFSCTPTYNDRNSASTFQETPTLPRSYQDYFLLWVVTLVANVISLTITAGEEACSDASDAENRDPWDLPQPVPCACHTLLIDHASLVSASAGSLAAHAGLSTQTQSLSCWVTQLLSLLEHGRPFPRS